jgi:general secretion pathway protein I
MIRRPSSLRKRPLAFTLLEVMIALAILASALTVMLGAMATAQQQGVYSSDLTVVSLLARAKMTDLEYGLIEDDFPESEDIQSGDFSAEGHSEITWEATISPVEISDESKQALLAEINAQLFGGDSSGALQGNAAFSSMLPTLIGQMPEMINRIGEKVRRIVLIVSFPFLGRSTEFKLSYYAVDRSSAGFDIFGDMQFPETKGDK